MARANIDIAFRQKLGGLAATQTAAKKTTSAIGGLTKAAGALGLAFGAAGLLRVLRSSISAAIEQQQAFAQVAQVVKSTGMAAGLTAKELAAMASEQQKLNNVGDETVLRMQSVLLTFTKIGKETFPAASQAVIDVATRMRMDLSSAALQVGKALNDPVANMGALSRAGIQFTKADKELIKSLWETGRAAEAQAVIIKELEAQFGGAGAAAREAAGGGLTAFKNTAGDVSEVIGAELIPALDDAGNAFADFLSKKEVQDTIGLFIATLLRGGNVMAAWTRSVQDGTDAGDDFDTHLVARSMHLKSLAEAEEAAARAAKAYAEAQKAAAKADEERVKRIREINSELQAMVDASKEGFLGVEAAIEALQPLLDGLDLEIKVPEITITEDTVTGLEVIEDLTAEHSALGMKKGWSAAEKEFATMFERAIAGAIYDAFTTGFDPEATFGHLGAMLGQSLAGPIGAAVGQFVGETVGAALFDVGQPHGFVGVITELDHVVGELAGAADSLRTAAEAFGNSVREILRMTGGSLDFGNIAVQQINSSAFEASIPATSGFGPEVPGLANPNQDSAQFLGLVGTGDTIQAAIDDLIRQIVEGWENAVETGIVAVDGLNSFFVTAIANSGARSMDELQQTLRAATEIFLAGMDDVGASFFTGINELMAMFSEGVRLGLSDTPQFQAAIEAGFDDLFAGISGYAAPEMADLAALTEMLTASFDRLQVSEAEQIRLLAELERHTNLYNDQLQANFLGNFLSIIEQIPGKEADAARVRAELAQLQFQIALKKLKLEARALGAFTDAFKDFFREARRFGRDLDNFFPRIEEAAAGGTYGTGPGPIPVDITNPRDIGAAVADFQTDIDDFDWWAEIGRPINESFRDQLRQLRLVERLGQGAGTIQAAIDAAQDIIDGLFAQGDVTGTPGNPNYISPQDIADFMTLSVAQALEGLSGEELEEALARLRELGWTAEQVAEALEAAMEDVIQSLVDFRGGLFDPGSPFAQGTPAEQAAQAAQDAMDIMAEVLRGDLTNLPDLQDAIALALGLGQDAFGNATDMFDFFAGPLVDMLDQVLAGLGLPGLGGGGGLGDIPPAPPPKPIGEEFSDALSPLEDVVFDQFTLTRDRATVERAEQLSMLQTINTTLQKRGDGGSLITRV